MKLLHKENREERYHKINMRNKMIASVGFVVGDAILSLEYLFEGVIEPWRSRSQVEDPWPI